MTPFDYQRASSAADAVARISRGGAFLAGGTNLVDHLRLGLRSPSHLVDIGRLPLDQIRRNEDGVLHIGAFEWNWGTNDLSGWSMANNVFSYTPAARTFIYAPPPTESLRRNFVDAIAQLHATETVQADPQFTNASTGDFSLRASSPGIGAASDGTNLGAF